MTTNVDSEGSGASQTSHRVTRRETVKGEARYDARVRLNGKPAKKTFRRRGDADAWVRQVLADDLAGVAIDPRAA